jgi:hypothetical protein
MSKNLKNITLLILMLIVSLSFLLVCTTGCIRVGFVGSGNVVSEEREVSGFDEISVSTGINLFVEQTGQETLLVEAEDNILPKIESQVKNGTLLIRIKPMSFGGLNATEPINCYVTVEDISNIDASSGSNVNTDLLKSDELIIDMSSGSNGYFEIDVDYLDLDISSGSKVEISGDADHQNADISSGSQYDAGDLISKEAIIDVSSGSRAEINVTEDLEVDISSGSSVKYIGSPEVKTDISSGGSLESIPE